MNQKLECPNCGARLFPEDDSCYVCGMSREEILKHIADTQPEKTETETVDNAVQNDAQEAPEQDTYDFENEEYAYEEESRKPKSSKTKKAAVICGICVGVVAVIAAIICVCFYNGVFSPAPQTEDCTIYFDKPLSDINFIDSQGTVYNWGGDVEVIYTLNDKEQESPCKISDEYDNLWECTIPADARDISFSPSTTDNIRTVSVAEPKDEYVYYVTDTLLDESLEISVSYCPLTEFGNMGINYVQPTEEETTVPPTETTTEAPSVEETTVATEPTTEPVVTDPYTITVPSSWSSGATVVTNGNCTSYYETYNYKNYQMGMLMTIYVVDSSDKNYSNMNNVKLVKKTSDGKKKVVVITPSDVEFNDADETATNNYIALSNLTNQVISSITAN